jgi:hypothetical protein
MACVIRSLGGLRSVAFAPMLLAALALSSRSGRAEEAGKVDPTSPSEATAPHNATPHDVAATANDAIARLIAQLGDDRFDMREEASRRLSQMGVEIRPALDAAILDRDPEIRVRARHIMTIILEEDFQRRLDAFAADVNDAKHLDLPGWARYRQVVGNNPTARRFFVDMQRAEPKLFQSVEEGHSETESALQTCVTQNLIREMPRRVYYNGNNVSLASIAAMFFVGADPHVALSDELGMQIVMLSNQSSLQVLSRSGSQFKLLKKILGAWVSRDASGDLLARNLWLALTYELKEGLRPAVATLKQGNQLTWVRPTALMLIAKFGDKSELPVVESSLKDTDVCWQTVAHGRQIETQVRDVALIVDMHLHGQDPKDFGFPHVDFSYSSMGGIGFYSDFERDKVRKKWDTWLSQHRVANGASTTASTPPISPPPKKLRHDQDDIFSR